MGVEMSVQHTDQAAFAAIRKVTILGGIVNLLLAALKLAVGWLTGSVALVADGAHSVSDLLSDAIVLLGAWLGGLPPDDNHPYGHGKLETFAALGVSLLVVLAGVGIAMEAGRALYEHEVFRPGVTVLLVAALSVLVKEALFQVTRKVARATRSPSVSANAWHHRSDALSSVAVLVGGGVGMLGWGHGDQVAGIVVGIMVVGAGARLGWDAVRELSEAAISQEELARLRAVLDRCEDIAGWHRLRTRRVGREVFVDLHVYMDETLTVKCSHEIVDRIEEELARALQQPANIVTHVDPSPGP